MVAIRPAATISRMIVQQRTAEIGFEQTSDVGEILRQDRLIEAELFPQLGNSRRIGRNPALGEQQFGGIARHDMNNEEDDRDHGPDQGERNSNSCQRVAEHRFQPTATSSKVVPE
jgi:hypothetical protein